VKAFSRAGLCPRSSGAAVGAPGEQHAERLLARHRLEPAVDLPGERAHVGTADGVEVGRQHAAGRIEEAPVGGVRIGAADEAQGGDMVGRHHAGVRGMELPAVAQLHQAVADGVDALRDHQHGPGHFLGEEVAQGPVEAAGEADALALAGDQRERALDPEHRLGLPREDPPPRLLHIDVPDLLAGGRDEVEDARDRTAGGWLQGFHNG
jgi:hypothetical protein